MALSKIIQIGQPERNDAVLKLLGWIQKRIKIDQFEISLWEIDHTDTTRNFLENPMIKTLFAIIDPRSRRLVVSTEIPSVCSGGAKFVAFFIRSEGSVLDLTNIDESVIYGTCVLEQTAASLMNVIGTVFNRFVFETIDWNPSTSKELNVLYCRLMALLTESVSEEEKKTILYIPFKLKNKRKIKELCNDNDFIQQLEYIVIHWTKQIKAGLSDCSRAVETDRLGPMSEVAYWCSRAIDLRAISQMLLEADVLNTLSTLESVHSKFCAPMKLLSENVAKGAEEAEDNVKFLAILQDPCQKLSNIGFDQIHQLLPKLLGCTRVIYCLSKKYNTTDRISGLLRKISNKIICRCCEHIVLDDVFTGDVNYAIKKLKECIDCCSQWKKNYNKISMSIMKRSAKQNDTGRAQWKINDSSIFVEIDAFIQRCDDILCVCEGRIQFVLIDSSAKSIKLSSKGSNRLEIEQSLSDISNKMKVNLERLSQLPYDILDVRAAEWYDDFNIFKCVLKDLDTMYSTVIDQVFEPVKHIEIAVGLLKSFQKLASRRAILICIKKHTGNTQKLFSQLCGDTRKEFDNFMHHPPLRVNEPTYAGSALWARSLLIKVSHCWNLIIQLSDDIIPVSPNMKERYDNLVDALQSYQLLRYHKWLDCVSPLIEDDVLQSKLDKPLLSRQMDVQHDVKGSPAYLLCNFDNDLIALCDEIFYWERLHFEKFEVPHILLSVCHQYDTLKVMRERVMILVRTFNGLLDDLPCNNRLYSDHLRKMEKKIYPGLNKLFWSSRSNVVEKFVQSSINQIQCVYKEIKEFHRATLTINEQFHRLESMLLVSIDRNKSYKDKHFESLQKEHRNVSKINCLQIHDSIKENIEGLKYQFVDGSDGIQHEWNKYIKHIDERMLEALSKCVKMSLCKLGLAIHSAKGLEESLTLIECSVILNHGRVECRPSMIDLTNIVNRLTKDLIGVVKSIPRLQIVIKNDRPLTSPNKQDDYFYDRISTDKGTLQLIVQIMNGVASTAVKVQCKAQEWDKYESLWKIDKGLFIKRYSQSSKSIDCFDKDIRNYKEQSKKIDSEESYVKVTFVKLNFSQLKNACLLHSIDWQEKLTALLGKKSKLNLSNLHIFFDENTKKLDRIPRNVNEFKITTHTIENVKVRMHVIEEEMLALEKSYIILKKLSIQNDDWTKRSLESLSPKLEILKGVVGNTDIHIQQCKIKIKNGLQISVQDFVGKMKGLQKTITAILSTDQASSSEELNMKIKSIQASILEIRSQEQALLSGLDLFAMDIPDDKMLRECENMIEQMNSISNLKSEWKNSYEIWRTVPISKMDLRSMEHMVNDFSRNISKFRKEIRNWNKWRDLKQNIDEARELLPFIADLKANALKERRCVAITDSNGKSLGLDSDTFTLNDVFSVNVQKDQYFVSQISFQAK